MQLLRVSITLFPIKETLFERIAGCKYFSKFDCKSGFYQIMIRSEDRWKTSFSSLNGQFQWKVMPFGLKNAPAYFQRRMDSIFRNIDWLFVYIDDILIFSKTLEEHVQQFKEFYEICKKHGIVLSATKMVIGEKEMEFLGFNIQGGKNQLQNHILEKIEKFPDIIEDKKQLQRFLGYLNYIGNFYSKIGIRSRLELLFLIISFIYYLIVLVVVCSRVLNL